MLVRHVQSGRTTSYTGVVCKAADARYRLIIVIAGIHNDLHNQTQLCFNADHRLQPATPHPDIASVGGYLDVANVPGFPPA